MVLLSHADLRLNHSNVNFSSLSVFIDIEYCSCFFSREYKSLSYKAHDYHSQQPWEISHPSPMRTHRSLKRRGLPWPRWPLRGRLCRPKSSSWLRLSGSSMWGSSSSPSPGKSSRSSSSISDELVCQLVGDAVLVSALSSLDPAAGCSASLLLEHGTG